MESFSQQHPAWQRTLSAQVSIETVSKIPKQIKGIAQPFELGGKTRLI